MTARKNTEVFLKAIQIQGFKSFADKIRLELQAGLSVIVGPNGSGKSNVADAVRWVLGEQSAKTLRGSKMEDIIFAGSSARRPVGMAEVSLIFDNSTGLFALDYDEVVVTRRVYRDGEGQFFINRTPCRLRDIQELFLDTGSGKEGFSIISQGRVEEILNLKSEERRLLIEEVAGISKFRLRKKEALKKLEDTQNNVNRLNDIIAEVEARIEPLAKQAEVARVSKELNADLQNTEIILIVNELADVMQRLTKSQKDIQGLQDELTVLTARITEEESANLHQKYEQNQLEQKVQDLQTEVYTLETNVKELAHESTLLTERQGFIKEQIGRLEKEMTALTEGLTLSDEKVTKFREKEADLKQTLLAASAVLQDREERLAQMRSLSGGGRIEALKSEIFDALSAKSHLMNDLAEVEHKKTSAQKQELQLTQEIRSQEEKKDLLVVENSQQDDKKKKIEIRIREILAEIGAVNSAVRQIEEKQLRTEEGHTQVQRQLDHASARLNALQTLKENLDGYQKGVKEVIFACRKGEIKCQAVYGTVAENMEVDSLYELAIETALGASMQNIIVETTEDGKRCIEYLKRTHNGRATFLPLDAIRGGKVTVDAKIRNTKGFLGVAVDLVRYDQKFTAVAESMLGRILLTEDMDSAIEVARLGGYRTRVVTLQGDQVNTGGSLTGGSIKGQNSGLIGRAREIEELSAKVKELGAELDNKKNSLATIKKEREDALLQKETLDTDIKGLNDSLNIMSVERKHRDERINRINDALKMLHYDLKETAAELNSIAAAQVRLDDSLQQSEERIMLLQTEQSELEKTLKETAVQAQELSDEITSAKIEAAKWEQELSQTRELMAEEKERYHLGLQSVAEKKAQLAQQQLSLEELVKNQAEAEHGVESLNVELNEKRYNLVNMRTERETLAVRTIEQEQAILVMNRKARDIEQQLHQSELRITRYQTESETGMARLTEEYGLTWEEVHPYRTDDKKEVLQEKVAGLRHQIDILGPVNYTALDEYPETLKRYEFMSSQRDDLIKAELSLRELIGDLDKSMIERFAEGFKAVNEAFKDVFKELFNGGYAELQLDDPQNLLETGVKIIAQPPGKKPQLLSLLSGGERSFTAIALLFAFLKVKPSPFCLLDEIEAALDEANVRRFVQYLHRLSAYTQFILISHRRGTMEAADKLYGITMEESGVSKLLTVELEGRLDHSVIA